MELVALPAFSDNYIWLLSQQNHAIVVDPGEAQPVLDALTREQLTLDAILVTHHHSDHIGAVAALREATGATVFGPAKEAIPQPYQPVGAGTPVRALDLDWQVLDVPGHTAGHIAYFCADPRLGEPVLFCGDTLFSGGCGRLFEGTPAQMLDSLTRLADLAGNTRICCAHEYTLSNLKFARAVEPGNQDLANYWTQCESQRQAGYPTLPSHLALELKINPFLRILQPSVYHAVRQHAPTANDPVSDFAALREWKNRF